MIDLDKKILDELGIYLGSYGDLDLKTQVAPIARRIYESRRTGNRVYTVGNGGSAFTAGHFALDLEKYTANRYLLGVRAYCFNTIGLTAWENDFCFDEGLAELIPLHVGDHDTVVFFSTSGESRNLVNAIDAANLTGAVTIGILGPNQYSPMAESVDMGAHVRAFDVRYVEDVHLIICHAIAGAIRSLILADAQAVGYHPTADEIAFGVLAGKVVP